MNIAVLHPNSGWILSTIAERLCQAAPDHFIPVPFGASDTEGAKAELSFRPDAILYVDIQGCWSSEVVESVSYAKHVGLFTHLDLNASSSFLPDWDRLDGVIHMCQRYYSRFVANGWYRPNQMAVIRPGEVSHIPLQKIRLGVVQRGEHTGKGAAFLPAVMSSLSQEIRDALELHICGSGWSVDEHYQLGGVDVVTYPEDEYAQMPSRYDYLLIPSLYEGGPMGLLEALAAGRPVIAADVGWVNEFATGMVIDGRPPYVEVFPPGNVSLCRAALERIVLPCQMARRTVASMSYAQYARDVLAFIEGLEVER